uniref:Zinc finger protein n=1 Tax=Talaromyces marneffei PM1 TaxID=1077442 RepID=A0A093UQK7_TALMA
MADQFRHWPCPYCFEDQRTAKKLQRHLNVGKLVSRSFGSTRSSSEHEGALCQALSKEIKQASPMDTLTCPETDCLMFYSQQSSLLRHYHSHVMYTTFCACGKRMENLRSLELHIGICKQMIITDDSDLTQQKGQLLFLKERLCKEAAAKVNAHLGKSTTTKRKGNDSNPPMTKSGKSPRLCDTSDCRNFATDMVDVATSDLPLPDDFPIPDGFDWDFLGTEGFMFSPQLWSGPYFNMGRDTLLQ